CTTPGIPSRRVPDPIANHGRNRSPKLKSEQVALTAQDGATIAAQWHYDDAAKPRTAIIIAHPTTDWRNHFLLAGLARQGIGALGYCTRFTAREAELMLEETLLDTAAA